MTTAKASLFDIAPEDRARSRPLSPLGLARLSLEGLSIGDAFGERFFGSPATVQSLIEQRAMPREPWHWTDDTAMALSIYEVLLDRGRIDRGALARRFENATAPIRRRGYGGAAHDILAKLADGAPWNEVAREPFDGQGSMGNGGAMRSRRSSAILLERPRRRGRKRARVRRADACAPGTLPALLPSPRRRRLRGATRRRRGLCGGAVFRADRRAHAGGRNAETAPSRRGGSSLRTAGTGGSAPRQRQSRYLPPTRCRSHFGAQRHMDDFEAALWSPVSGPAIATPPAPSAASSRSRRVQRHPGGSRELTSRLILGDTLSGTLSAVETTGRPAAGALEAQEEKEEQDRHKSRKATTDPRLIFPVRG
ncbi:MAG: ADP-ribosylglycohydrolase family protein [Myxococcales bacterium]|nr:ADP-ribosylglycohydrolase family protein [Myxococcales bacterium]